MVPADSCSLPFLGGKYLKTQDAETPHDSRNSFFCRYCGKGFMSNKAVAGHLRIHSHHHPTSKTELQQQQQDDDDDDDDDFFSCLVCTESFSSMKLLCQHTNIHRHMDSSQESNISSSGADTIVKQGNGPHTINLLKDFNFKWSRTGKRGSNRITSQDAQPLKLRVRPPHMETRKNKKMKTEDTKMEFELGGTKSESGVDPCHARRSRKNKAVKSEHQCEICGKTFETGQALEPCMMTPMLLPHLSQQPDPSHPKTMLDFDLNIPYQQ
ncbi:hypothetical protein ES319_D05G076200v1 [Gossypium barbadense]|uniref:C2H2-type domain-containing protein n=2 Tax=Gossypium TaxID=3633 RepID=A0A5J5RHD7_GOSBA|nr:hypothetical protein ES319_D05G076200v1 [Gossypium barbadense]TYG67493.1 hypothetical protein ES288_D05G080600v1 [Gossypium darwinii]